MNKQELYERLFTQFPILKYLKDNEIMEIEFEETSVILKMKFNKETKEYEIIKPLEFNDCVEMAQFFFTIANGFIDEETGRNSLEAAIESNLNKDEDDIHE